nr:MAG TPA: hypothetical protein [Caudoviricetes sp.]
MAFGSRLYFWRFWDLNKIIINRLIYIKYF